MTPQQKAKELVNKLILSRNAQDDYWMCEDLAKQCALIAVDELLNIIGNKNSWEEYEYWNQVKTEIEKL